MSKWVNEPEQSRNIQRHNIKVHPISQKQASPILTPYLHGIFIHRPSFFSIIMNRFSYRLSKGHNNHEHRTFDFLFYPLFCTEHLELMLFEGCEVCIGKKKFQGRLIFFLTRKSNYSRVFINERSVILNLKILLLEII